MISSVIDRMQRIAASLLLCLALAPVAHAEGRPRLSVERAVLRTSAGDLLVAFYPDLAPQSVRQVERLIESGAYDHADLTYASQGFVAQFSVDDASLDVPTLPAERSPAMHHKRGAVSLTHADNDPNGGKASFISLDEHPELDGKYTVIGEVVDGFGTLATLDATPTDPDGAPQAAVTLAKASLLKTPAEQFTLALSDGQARRAEQGDAPSAEAPVSGAVGALTSVLVASLATVVGLAGLGLLLRRWFGEGALRSCLVGSALVSGIALTAYATPRLAGHGVWAAAGLAGVIGLLRLLGRFEV